jgi:hypothetical protein
MMIMTTPRIYLALPCSYIHILIPELVLKKDTLLHFPFPSAIYEGLQDE